MGHRSHMRVGMRRRIRLVLSASFVLGLGLIVLLAIVVLKRVYELKDQQIVGWLIACALAVSVISMALWWQSHQSLSALFKRAGKYSLLDPLRRRRRRML